MFLCTDYVHGRLGQDWFHDVVQGDGGLNRNLQAHAHIDAHEGFVKLEEADAVTATLWREFI